MTKPNTAAAKAEAPAKAAKPAKVEILTTAAKVNEAIAKISKAGKAFEKLIHSAACSVLYHADKHGDITLANKLIEALPNMARKNALRDWLMAYGKFAYDATNKAMIYDKTKTTDQSAAEAEPFWTFKPEAAYKPLDLMAEIKRLVAKIDAHDKMAQTDPKKAGEVDAQLALKVRELANIV